MSPWPKHVEEIRLARSVRAHDEHPLGEFDVRLAKIAPVLEMDSSKAEAGAGPSTDVHAVHIMPD